MSDFKKMFTLKQHTPIIHFQSEQKGATFRATELKPKFDRFLLEYFKKNNIKYTDFLIPGEKKAFNYKVKIEEFSEGKPFIYESEYIGNMDENSKKINEKFIKGTIDIWFKSFYPLLIEAVKRNFPTFLLGTNFGARSSKGYGSFYLYDSEAEQYIKPDYSTFDKKVYSFTTTRGDCISDIALLSSFFRSGINYPDHRDKTKTRIYIKSALFSYLNDKTNISYDKKQIKHVFIDLDVDADEKATLARELFGLSLRQEWGKDYNGMVITKNNDDISRFKSPIIFRAFIVEDTDPKPTSIIKVYFWADDSYKAMLGKAFTLRSSNSGKTLPLKVPDAFSFEEFFNYLAKEYVFTIDRTYISQPEAVKLTKMLKDIKESANV